MSVPPCGRQLEFGLLAEGRFQGNALIKGIAIGLRTGGFIYPEWIVVGCLILLMRGGEKIFARSGAAQVEI